VSFWFEYEDDHRSHDKHKKQADALSPTSTSLVSTGENKGQNETKENVLRDKDIAGK